MDETAFRLFLKRGGRSPRMADSIVALVHEFAGYLREQCDQELDAAAPQDLESYVAWVEQAPKSSAKGHLHALAYYYEFTGNEAVRSTAGRLRQERITRSSFPLKSFRGARPEHLRALAAAGIRSAEQMLQAGRTPRDRAKLAGRTGIPVETILELVKLADLARLPGVKGIRARLYLDAGMDTPAKIAACEPDEFRALIVDFVERTGFQGVATLPAEARATVRTARALPDVVEYE
jgi:hypothetical protein